MKFLDKDKKKYSGSKAAIAFYVLAVLFVMYGAYMIFTVYEYLIDYYANYSVGMWDDVANTLQYFASNCIPYFVYAILCYGIGMILYRLHDMKSAFMNNHITDEQNEEEILVADTIEYNTEEKTA